MSLNWRSLCVHTSDITITALVWEKGRVWNHYQGMYTDTRTRWSHSDSIVSREMTSSDYEMRLGRQEACRLRDLRHIYN